MRTEELLRGANAPLADIFEGLLADVGAHTRLSARDRALAELSALMGCGGTDAFRARLADALAEGLAPEAVREAVMQAAAYLGMGRALPFVQAAAQAFAERNIAFPPEPQLAGHVAGNLHVGNDAAFLGEVILVLLPWIGYPRSLNALGCVRGAIKA